MVDNMTMIAASIAVGIGTIATAISQSMIGAAAVGAASEDEKFFSKALILIAIPETLAIFGLIIALIELFVVQ